MVTSSQLYTVNLIQITVPWRGKGNGNPLRYSCLENPVDRGAWWAAVHRVAQSQTRLKRLSMQACFGEGNGNPLQCSCLENPRDRGGWWAAVYGISQSQTRLKWLSSSSSPLEVSPVPRAKSCLGLSPSEWAGPASTQLVPLQEGSAITFGPQASRVTPAPFLPARQGLPPQHDSRPFTCLFLCPCLLVISPTVSHSACSKRPRTASIPVTSQGASPSTSGIRIRNTQAYLLKD